MRLRLRVTILRLRDDALAHGESPGTPSVSGPQTLVAAAALLDAELGVMRLLLLGARGVSGVTGVARPRASV